MQPAANGLCPPGRLACCLEPPGQVKTWVKQVGRGADWGDGQKHGSCAGGKHRWYAGQVDIRVWSAAGKLPKYYRFPENTSRRR